MTQVQRVNMMPQERFDRGDWLSHEGFIHDDFKLYNKSFFSGATTYIVSGGEILVDGGFTIHVDVNDNLTLFNTGDESSFFRGDSATISLSAVLGPSTDSFVWIRLVPSDSANAHLIGDGIRVFWDPTLNVNGVIGGEFSQSIKTAAVAYIQGQTILGEEPPLGSHFLGISLGSFPGGSDIIPLAIITTDAFGITAITDARKLFFRLGRGNFTLADLPEDTMNYNFPWVSKNDSGNAVTVAAAYEEGDRGIYTLKDDLDSIKTELKFIKWGTTTTRKWYENAPSSLAGLAEPIIMTDGGIWNWGTVPNTLSWSADALFLFPGPIAAYTNTMAAGSVIMAVDDMVTYVDLDPTASVVVVPQPVSAANYTDQLNRVIVARRQGGSVYVGIY